MFKRKIYDKLLAWKNESAGKTALLVEGPRRVGKSTTVEEFAKNEYESYILIDFSTAPPEVRELFSDLSDLRIYSSPAKSGSSICIPWIMKNFSGHKATP